MLQNTDLTDFNKKASRLWRFFCNYIIICAFESGEKMFLAVDESNLDMAAEVYMFSWKDSHKDICSREFIEKHDAEYMKAFLLGKMNEGCRLFLLCSGQKPVGTVGVSRDDEICFLYVLPEEQGRGFGSELLNYVLTLCKDPWVTVLESNRKAIRFYEKHGFEFWGKKENISPKNRISEYKYVYRGTNM